MTLTYVELPYACMPVADDPDLRSDIEEMKERMEKQYYIDLEQAILRWKDFPRPVLSLEPLAPIKLSDLAPKRGAA